MRYATSSRFLRPLIMLLIPLIIIIGVVRTLATDTYLSFEYGKANFPVDQFGFDPTTRYTHATANFKYVREDQPLNVLAEQQHDRSPLYNNRELNHMQDVQTVFQIISKVWQLAIVILLVVILVSLLQPKSWIALFSAIKIGSLITAGFVVMVGLLAVLAWQSWFLVFHQVFFPPGSWTFDFSDTLIRLFPERFWFDAAINISLLSVAASLIIFFASIVPEKLLQKRSTN